MPEAGRPAEDVEDAAIDEAVDFVDEETTQGTSLRVLLRASANDPHELVHVDPTRRDGSQTYRILCADFVLRHEADSPVPIHLMQVKKGPIEGARGLGLLERHGRKRRSLRGVLGEPLVHMAVLDQVDVVLLGIERARIRPREMVPCVWQQNISVGVLLFDLRGGPSRSGQVGQWRRV